MHVTVLGSGTLLPDAGRHSAAHHVSLGDASVLLDCGSGTVHGLARHGIDWEGLTHVAVTHYHPDHVGDLSALMFALRGRAGWLEREGRGLAPPAPPLTLFGPPGFRTYLERAASALGAHVLDPKRPIRVEELAPRVAFDDPQYRFRIEAHPTPHTEESVAYRLSGDEGTVGYTGDTGPSEEMAAFLRGAGLVISECAWSESGQGPGHLAPEDVAELAHTVRPELLILTHVYPPMTPEEAVSRVLAGYDGTVVAGRDGLRASRGPHGWTVDRGRRDV
jgi:ribonuclease BN (tRNA processing enzyme)